MNSPQEQIYWKVLSQDRNSCRARYDLMVNYPLNQWTKPIYQNSKLMIFQNKSDAQLFAFYYDTIVPCYAKNTVPLHYILYSMSLRNPNVDIFWDEYNQIIANAKRRFSAKICTQIIAAPTGTLGADEVMCLE